MSEEFVIDVDDAVYRLRTGDMSRRWVFFVGDEHTDEEMMGLVDALLEHPDVYTRIWLNDNRLTDVVGSKLACYVAASKTIELIELSGNDFTDATVVGLARAMRTNTTLRYLCASVQNQRTIDEVREELRHCPLATTWMFNSRNLFNDA